MPEKHDSLSDAPETLAPNDHRRLGKELGLFTSSDLIGSGLPLFLPKGATLRRLIEQFIIDTETAWGYNHVVTPDIAKLDLYRTSGHYPYYKDSMYAPIVIDEHEYMLRPMTCPHHFQIFSERPRSYRELPFRIAELAKLYRYEGSGELAGLVRVRSFCLSDAHILCAHSEQAGQEVSRALDLIEHVAGIFGLELGKDYWYRLSLGDRANEEKYYKNDAAWEEGEALLRSVLQKRKGEFTEAKDEAAFYGPKIDIQMRDVRGKENTAFTVQYDFCMPDRFELNYIDADGSEKRVVAVHRSSVGAIERFMAFIIEHYAGAFPLWLSPVQVAVLPVSEKYNEYAESVLQSLRESGLRAELDASDESLGKKIRNAKTQKIPYILVLGEKEASSGSVTLESRDQGSLGAMALADAIARLQGENAARKAS